MTFYHFGNCMALAYAPYYLTYKFAGLSEYGAFWKCVTAGGVYTYIEEDDTEPAVSIAGMVNDSGHETSSGELGSVSDRRSAEIDMSPI